MKWLYPLGILSLCMQQLIAVVSLNDIEQSLKKLNTQKVQVLLAEYGPLLKSEKMRLLNILDSLTHPNDYLCKEAQDKAKGYELIEKIGCITSFFSCLLPMGVFLLRESRKAEQYAAKVVRKKDLTSFRPSITSCGMAIFWTLFCGSITLQINQYLKKIDALSVYEKYDTLHALISNFQEKQKDTVN
jgi:hypothetical protein